MTRHGKRSGLTNYRRKKRGLGGGGKVMQKRRAYWEQNGVRVPATTRWY